MKRTETNLTLPSIEEAVALIQDWAPVGKFCSLFPSIPEPTLRWQLTNRSKNGLEPHVQVIGKQLFISIKGYASWLNRYSEARDQEAREIV